MLLLNYKALLMLDTDGEIIPASLEIQYVLCVLNKDTEGEILPASLEIQYLLGALNCKKQTDCEGEILP